MRFYKQIEDGYIIAIGEGAGHEEITREEYDSLRSLIKARPTPDEGFDYRLRVDLSWELYELPPIVIDDETEISDTEALNIMLGGSV